MASAPATTFDTVRQLALALPEVTEGISFGTPAFHVRGKLLARLREDGETLAIETEPAEREFRILEWIAAAKTPATRAKRVEETARLAQANIRANQWRRPA